MQQHFYYAFKRCLALKKIIILTFTKLSLILTWTPSRNKKFTNKTFKFSYKKVDCLYRFNIMKRY